MSTSNRFSRQEGLVPRDRLLEETCTVIGVGAIGRQVALQLAALGAPTIQLIDFDVVEPSNVSTQGYYADEVGKLKVAATKAQIARIDPLLHVETVETRFLPKQPVGSAVFCCVDSISTRAAIWRALKNKCQFWADGRMLGEVMRILIATDVAQQDAYDKTLFAQSEARTGQCTARGVIYTAALAAGFMVHQFVRWLREIPVDQETVINLLAGQLDVIDD